MSNLLVVATAFGDQKSVTPQCEVAFRGESPVAAMLAADGKSLVARSAHWIDEPLNQGSAAVVGHIKSTSGGKVEFRLESTPDGRIPVRWQWQEYRLITFKGDDGVTSIQVPSDFVDASGKLLVDFTNEFSVGADATNVLMHIKCRKSAD